MYDFLTSYRDALSNPSSTTTLRWWLKKVYPTLTQEQRDIISQYSIDALNDDDGTCLVASATGTDLDNLSLFGKVTPLAPLGEGHSNKCFHVIFQSPFKVYALKSVVKHISPLFSVVTDVLHPPNSLAFYHKGIPTPEFIQEHFKHFDVMPTDVFIDYVRRSLYLCTDKACYIIAPKSNPHVSSNIANSNDIALERSGFLDKAVIHNIRIAFLSTLSPTAHAIDRAHQSIFDRTSVDDAFYIRVFKREYAYSVLEVAKLTSMNVYLNLNIATSMVKGDPT